MAFLKDVELTIRDDGWIVNTENLIYSDYNTTVSIPSHELSDGPTLNWFTKLFISPKEYRCGFKAAFVHDYMCRHKSLYSRKVSSLMLRDIWISCGLNSFKGAILCFCVDLYQLVKYGKTWGTAL
jgi:hypothetical protein